MLYRIERIADQLIHVANCMDTEQWLVVSVAAAVCGIIWMRGFGSRTGY